EPLRKSSRLSHAHESRYKICSDFFPSIHGSGGRVSDTKNQEFDRGTELPSIREGLPRHYQMRADRHYVDQLATQSAGDPVRMIPVNQLEAEPAEVGVSLRPLIESIRLHGVLHPLLVRRCETGYHVIAGHKRLAAAK